MQGKFSDINQKDWKRACKKLGLEVDCSRGKGSHFLVRHPRTNAKYTIQKDLHKFINMKIFKKMLEWGFEEKKIWDALA
jgi:predicted RNA binding protein YcfA (HicA-like mRNA interferase family)